MRVISMTAASADLIRLDGRRSGDTNQYHADEVLTGNGFTDGHLFDGQS